MDEFGILVLFFLSLWILVSTVTTLFIARCMGIKKERNDGI